MATDIAFALGVLALLGSRVPLGLKIFLTALAIVDDLGAVLVIAFFYTSGLNLMFLALAALTWGLALFAGWRGLFSLKIYAVLGAFLWFFVLESGLHATLAGALLALAVPIRRLDPAGYLASLNAAPQPTEGEDEEARLLDLEDLLERSQSPLHRLEHAIHPFVTYAVLPAFVLMNAGVAIGGGAGLGVVSLGVVVGAGLLAGIGFTVSLLVSNLAFGEGALLTQAKLGVLLASVTAAVLGAGWLLVVGKPGAECETLDGGVSAD